MTEFLNLLIDAKLDLCWSCYAAVNTVDKEILQLMYQAGCWNIFYGYETAIEELAENIQTNRKNKKEKTLRLKMDCFRQHKGKKNVFVENKIF